MTVTLDREPATEPPPSTDTVAAAEAETRTHTMYVIDEYGRPAKTLTWQVGDPNTEAAAAKTFRQCKESGYLTYATRAPGEHEVLHSFDAEAPTIVLTRPVQGG